MNNIKTFRTTKRKISQRGLSQKIGISQCYMNKIENKRENITVKLLIKIAKALNCSLDDIWTID